MLDMDRSAKFFTLIGEERLFKLEEFNQFFFMLEGFTFDSLLSFMVGKVEWEKLSALKNLGSVHFGLLEALLRLDLFGEGSLCAWEGSVHAVEEFLTSCDTAFAKKCLKKIEELSSN